MLTGGVCAVKLTMLDQMRVWAMLTGVALALYFFAKLSHGVETSTMVPLLVTAIGGFEIFLFGQDMWLRRKGRHG